jgi:membrane associated rhomboid family serine protease
MRSATPRPPRHPVPSRQRRPQPECRHRLDEPTGVRCDVCGRPICPRCASLERLQQRCPRDARWGPTPTLAPWLFPATFALLAVNLGMLVWAGIRSGHLGGLLSPDPFQLCQLGAVNTSAVLGQHQYWRLLTAVALHAGVLHLALNSYGLLLFGPALEQALGSWRFLAVYAGAGAAGAAASLALYHPLLGVGASGAIFGVGGALAAVFYHYRVGVGAGVWLYVATVVLVSLALSATHVGVDNAAHLVGLLAGLAAGALLVSGRRPLPAVGLAVPFLLAAVLTALAAATFTAQPGGAETVCIAAVWA